MPATLTTADAALKEDYLEPAREQLNNAHKLLSQIERNSKDVVGRRAVLSLHVSRNSGVGARAERGTLPTSGNQGYAEERVLVRYNYGSIEISGPSILAMRNDEGAFVRQTESEMKGVVNDLKRDVNRQLFGTSDGVIALVEGSGSTTTNIVFAAGTPQSAIRQLEVGMFIDIGTASPFTSVGTAREITANDGIALTVTPAFGGAPVDGDAIVRSGSGGSGSAQKELTGLQSIVDSTGTLFNVAPTTYPVWASTENSNSGTARPFTENLAAKVVNQVNIASGEDPNLIITSDGVNRSYAAQLQTQKRFTNTLDLKGGFKAISVATGDSELALTWDRDCPDTMAFFLATSHLTQHEMSDWEWMDEDGAVLRKVSGIDSYEATLFKYHELTTDQRNAHAKVLDLQTA